MTRRTQTLFFVVALLACLLSGAPSARVAELPDSVISAGDLAALCVSAYDTDAGYCAGYVTAVANRMAFTAVGSYGPCTFGAARSQQFTDLFVAYMQGHPDTRPAPADSVIALALARAFSCRHN